MRYNLNELLKARGNTRNVNDGEVTLDDISRVKVLSPGRKVFKRFIRNRLAVFGSCMLIFLFLLSFLGPVFYAYGEKDIFYKFDTQNINYAQAKENTTYNGYYIDSSITLERAISTAMNSNIKKMVSSGTEAVVVIGSEDSYFIEKVGDDIYTLSQAELTRIASVGSSVTRVGLYKSIERTIDYEIDEIEGLNEIAATKVKGSSGEFEFGDATYTYEKGEQAKTFYIYQKVEGVNYAGAAIDAGFEAAANAAAETGESFEYGGNSYYLVDKGNFYDIYSVGALNPAKVYTRLTADTVEVGGSFSDELRIQALLAGKEGGTISADGRVWTVVRDGEELYITDDQGNEYGELSAFTVRRYSGEDSMAYDLKKAINVAVEEMLAKDEKSIELSYNLPSQTETGEYNYDADGNIVYQETEMLITQRNTGSYVITCDQIIFVIDRYASPTFSHILGTDGDGFDVFARIMYGGRVSLMVGFVVVFLETFLGVIMGGLAGYYGGWVDNFIMRLVDIFYCLPSMPIMIILGAMMDAVRMEVTLRLWIMMAALGIMGWAGVARLVRGQILSLREQEFMVAAEATGIKVRDRIFHHLVPNVMPQLIVTATMGMGGVILTESTLSFLGLGVKHPLATWGTMINSVSSASAMAHYTFIWIPVGMLICLTVIAFNFVGDGLRDAYDPKAKR